MKPACEVVQVVKFTGMSLRKEEVNFFFSLLSSSSYRKPKMIPDDLLLSDGKGRFKYPFGSMTVGQTFLVTTEEAANSARVSSKYHTKVHPDRRFEVFRVDEGWRVIRTS